MAQLVARHPERPGKLSLACNPDITLDLLPMLEKRRAAGETIVAIGVVHDDPPYLPGDAEVEESVFDLLIDAPAESSRLFSTPNMPVNLQDHCIGLHASALVRDGGTLQIGIGSMGDALTAALLLRQRDNATYRALIDELGCVRAGPRRSSATAAWSRSAGGSTVAARCSCRVCWRWPRPAC